MFTKSSDILESLEEDYDSTESIDGGEITFEESENAQFSNSISFGAEVSLSSNNRDSLGNEHCVDREKGTSVEIGQNVENNGQSSDTRETSQQDSREKTEGFGAGVEGSLGAVYGVFGASISPSFNYNQEEKNTKTRSSTNSNTESNGWSRVNSNSKSDQTNIKTGFCGNFNFEKDDGKSEGNNTAEENGTSTGSQTTKTFSVPQFFDSVKNSASISEAEKHFQQYRGAIAITSRKCTTYKLEIQANDPPSFTEKFKAAV